MLTGPCRTYPLFVYLLALAGLFVGGCAVSSPRPPEIGTRLYVSSSVGAALRGAPTGSAPVLGVVELGSALVVDSPKTREEHRSDVWTYVRRVECPEESEETVCSGWAVSVDLVELGQMTKIEQRKTDSTIWIPHDRPEKPFGPETSYGIHVDGSYTYYCNQCESCTDENRGCPTEVKPDEHGTFQLTGHLYQSGNLVWAKERNTIFYLNRFGALCAFVPKDLDPEEYRDMACEQFD